MDERRMTAVAKALGSAPRRRVLKALASREQMTCTEIHRLLRLSQATTSHHLCALHEAGLIRVKKEGPYHRVTLNRATLDRFRDALG